MSFQDQLPLEEEPKRYRKYFGSPLGVESFVLANSLGEALEAHDPFDLACVQELIDGEWVVVVAATVRCAHCNMSAADVERYRFDDEPKLECCELKGEEWRTT